MKSRYLLPFAVVSPFLPDPLVAQSLTDPAAQLDGSAELIKVEDPVSGIELPTDTRGVRMQKLESRIEMQREELLAQLNRAVATANCQTNEDVAAVTAQFMRDNFESYTTLGTLEARLGELKADAEADLRQRMREDPSVASYRAQLQTVTTEAADDALEEEAKAALSVFTAIRTAEATANPEE